MLRTIYTLLIIGCARMNFAYIKNGWFNKVFRQ